MTITAWTGGGGGSSEGVTDRFGPRKNCMGDARSIFPGVPDFRGCQIYCDTVQKSEELSLSFVLAHCGTAHDSSLFATDIVMLLWFRPLHHVFMRESGAAP